MLAPSREEFHKWCLLFALNHWIWHVFELTSYTKHWLTIINNTHYEIGSVGGSLSEYMDDNDLENFFEILEAQQWWSSFVRSSSFVPLSTPTGSTFVMLFNMVTYKWSSVLSWNSIISSHSTSNCHQTFKTQNNKIEIDPQNVTVRFLLDFPQSWTFH